MCVDKGNSMERKKSRKMRQVHRNICVFLIFEPSTYTAANPKSSVRRIQQKEGWVLCGREGEIVSSGRLRKEIRDGQRTRKRAGRVIRRITETKETYFATRNNELCNAIVLYLNNGQKNRTCILRTCIQIHINTNTHTNRSDTKINRTFANNLL